MLLNRDIADDLRASLEERNHDSDVSLLRLSIGLASLTITSFLALGLYYAREAFSRGGRYLKPVVLALFYFAVYHIFISAVQRAIDKPIQAAVRRAGNRAGVRPKVQAFVGWVLFLGALYVLGKAVAWAIEPWVPEALNDDHQTSLDDHAQADGSTADDHIDAPADDD